MARPLATDATAKEFPYRDGNVWKMILGAVCDCWDEDDNSDDDKSDFEDDWIEDLQSQQLS